MSTRREVLVAGIGAAVAAAAAGAPAQAAAAPILDEAAFVARIRSGAKHKQAIGAARVNDAAALQFAVNTLNGFQSGWNEPASNVEIAVVLFGSACVLGLDDTAWQAHKIADIVRKFPGEWLTPEASQGNPWSHLAGTTAGPRGDRSIPALVARKVRIAVCNTALGEIANRIVAAGTTAGAGTDAFAIQAHLREHILPGCDVVPAGISSVAVLQENGYTYFSAAL
ncbi:MAG TPA: hypothetical protein VHT53_04725 [Candidatus Elarobacter sp.]|jgi:intracellular sulfur oxidation DsrE/DsrF family protein|nr:hypothetical protein [Candidatus Elarobacter sp.]